MSKKGWIDQNFKDRTKCQEIICIVWKNQGLGDTEVTIIPTDKVVEVVGFLDSLTRLDEKANLTQLRSFIKAIKSDAGS